MGRLQILTVAICVTINMLDGFDVLVMAFIAPSISQEWELSLIELGGLFSAGLGGMSLGALFLTSIADVYGRKKAILIALVTMSTGMFLSAVTKEYWQLIALRLLTGLGIGLALASLNTLVAEYSSTKRKNLSVAILHSGYPVGAILGGVIAALFIGQFGWMSLFVFGGLLSLVMIPVVIIWLPESLDYLLKVRPKGALHSVNAILIRMKQSEINELPALAVEVPDDAPTVKSLLKKDLIQPTLFLWLAYFMLMASFYFVLSWTPKILIDAGLSMSSGISSGVIMNLGGVIGGLLLGYFSTQFGLKRLTKWVMLLCALSMFAFGYFSENISVLLMIVFFIGFFMVSSMIGLYALAPDIYHTGIRNTGMGWAIGTGRIGAIVGPYVAGLLLESGWSSTNCFFVFLTPMLIAAFAVSHVNNVKVLKSV